MIVRYASARSKEAARLSALIARQLVWIFLAGGAGATLRVLLVDLVEARLGTRLPFAGILAANVIGSLLAGMVWTGFAPGPARTIILGGLLGGFTTYSAFALLTVELAQPGRLGVLGLQLSLHLVGGVGAVLAGAMLVRFAGLAAA